MNYSMREKIYSRHIYKVETTYEVWEHKYELWIIDQVRHVNMESAERFIAGLSKNRTVRNVRYEEF